MQTPESIRAIRLFGASQAQPAEAPNALGRAFLAKCQVASSGWPPVDPKPGTEVSRELMQWSLRNAEETEATPIGKGIHRPYQVKFASGSDSGSVTTKRAVFKTVHCQLESKRYCKSVDLKITGPQREILSYYMDKALGFDLVPPVVGREISGIGSGSAQAWVNEPTAWAWIDRDYDYRKDVRNPWLHRLAAFDFIRGEIDRHSNNWIMDAERRVYAIDNGYSFVKGDDRTFFRSSAGKCLVGTPIHPQVKAEIAAIREEPILQVLASAPFENGELEGVMKRIEELKRLDLWTKLGDLW